MHVHLSSNILEVDSLFISLFSKMAPYPVHLMQRWTKNVQFVLSIIGSGIALKYIF